MAAQGNVPHDDFESGFIVGWQTIKGTTAYVPHIPYKPYTKYGRTPFLMGVKKGIEKALGYELED